MNIRATITRRALALITCASILFSMNVLADDKEKSSPLTADDLLELLKNEGVITAAQAEKAANIAKSRLAKQNQAPVDYTTDKEKDVPEAAPVGVTRVPYIPKYIRDEIRDEVRAGLKKDVVDDVMAKAKTESWGVPGANPTWTNAIKFKGDIRFRYNGDRFDSGNSTQYRDFNAINAAGGTTKAGLNAFLNSTKNRDRLRLRFRLAMDAKVTDGVSVNMRIASGNPKDPVSTNQTLGGYGGSYTLSLDRAYIKFDSISRSSELYFGRMPNPWMSSELVWDADLNFDGIAYQYFFNRSGHAADVERQFDPFMTLGAFPLQEVALSKKDKWLFGGQTGFSYTTRANNRYKVGIAYYNYLNISGIQNAPDSNLKDFTAPPRVQKGNTLYDISNSTLDPQRELWALAADYRELSLTTLYDIAELAPTHVILSADYVKNIGFNESRIAARTGSTVAKKNVGYDVGIKVGSPEVIKRGDWDVSLHYRYLERDAVLDAFTDSDFHLGGTDGKGYILEYSHALKDNTWMQYKLISSNAISGPPLGITTMLVDLNARF
jgi:hypothetical protein